MLLATQETNTMIDPEGERAPLIYSDNNNNNNNRKIFLAHIYTRKDHARSD